MQLEQKIEAILFFKNEPVKASELRKLLEASEEEIIKAIKNLQDFYNDRGIIIVNDGEFVTLGTHPDASALVEKLQKDEFSRELGRAGLETLAIVLYKGPISRREIDHIRGVNSGFVLRTLLVRGLIERTEGIAGDRSYSYKPTLKALEHLGVSKKEDLPEYNEAFTKMAEFVKDNPIEEQ